MSHTLWNHTVSLGLMVMALGAMNACNQGKDRLVDRTEPTPPPVATPAPSGEALSGETSGDRQSFLQSRPDGMYYLCTVAPETVQPGGTLERGLCFYATKTGDRLSGHYADMATLGEVGLCLRGTLEGDHLVGEGREWIGNVGRQAMIPNAEGTTLVNWDRQGYLTVAQATNRQRTEWSGTEVEYKTARLDLSQFHLHPVPANAQPSDCFQE